MKEDVEQLRELIREIEGLAWLDEELDEIISVGKSETTETKDEKKKSFCGIKQINYSDSEQLDIIIRVLENYFVVLPKIQDEAEKVLLANLKISKIVFKDQDDSEFEKIDTTHQKLASFLNEIKKE